tara:strand:+ start:443 stop:772 length:330 start_codon:yes stop_codon:yes gene_type:complete
MTIVKLMDVAIARSGDKGDSTNIGIIANSKEIYEHLKGQLTADIVKSNFDKICQGNITRYELPNLNSFNFMLEHSLDGGGTSTLRSDAQGKVHGSALLHIDIEIPDKLL